jgi:SNF2 family DNA or RNA helicase
LNKYLTKIAVRIHQYEHKTDKSQKPKWVAEGKPVPKGYVMTTKSFYRRKGQKRKLGQTKKAAENENRYLFKIARTAEKQESGLQPHQEKALAKLDKEHGILLHHSTGSGKTKTFLTAAEKAQATSPDARVLIVAPASLQTNVDKEIKKHNLKIDPKRLEVYSYEKATNMADELAKKHYALAVADESHKLRNTDTKRTRELRDIISKSDRRILATATGNYNKLSDISPLVNMAAGEKVLPEVPKEMENRYTKQVAKRRNLVQVLTGKKPEMETKLDNEKELGKILNKYVSYYDAKDDPAAKDKFPVQTEEIIEVPMSDEQRKLYRYVEGDLPFMTRMKIRHNLPLDKKEKANLNAFSSGVRQVSNSMRQLSGDPDSVPYTPKIDMAASKLKEGLKTDKDFRGLVYSNYLDSGLNEYSRKLKEEGIKHNIYTGSVKREDKDRMVAEYNSGKVPVLLVSSSGSEGLDLKGTKKVQILEPHFNKSKLKQVIGRGARYESHTHLPKEERTMHVEHYQTVYPKPMIGKAPHSIDKYLSENSDDKNEIFDQVRELMKKNS